MGFSIAKDILPDLIITDKYFTNLDAMGFLIKRRTVSSIKNIPVFLIGEFSPNEILEYKKHNVAAFISAPIIPIALAERLYIFFNINPPEPANKTPMLLDIHARGRIIIVQIEGNFEPEKLELFNFLLRSFCKKRKIKSPKVFLIIPSLYPENITKDNIERLFRFINFKEFEIENLNIKILTSNKRVLDLINSNNQYNRYEKVKNYLEGLRTLQIDFDKKKSIRIDYLKEDCFYVFDLYDNNSKLIIPALTKVTPELIKELEQKNIAVLTYYSNFNIKEIAGNANESPDFSNNMDIIDKMIGDFEPIVTDPMYIEIWDDKHTLFFRKMKGKKVIIISDQKKIITCIVNSLEIYFDILKEYDGSNIESLLENDDYIVIFLDANLTKPSAFEVLHIIRKHATRRKTTVIILSSSMNKLSAVRFKNLGTDNIIVPPFTQIKIMRKVFDSVTSDRKR